MIFNVSVSDDNADLCDLIIRLTMILFENIQLRNIVFRIELGLT